MVCVGEGGGYLRSDGCLDAGLCHRSAVTECCGDDVKSKKRTRAPSYGLFFLCGRSGVVVFFVGCTQKIEFRKRGQSDEQAMMIMARWGRRAGRIKKKETVQVRGWDSPFVTKPKLSK
jgi:hypothetical protein